MFLCVCCLYFLSLHLYQLVCMVRPRFGVLHTHAKANLKLNRKRPDASSARFKTEIFAFSFYFYLKSKFRSKCELYFVGMALALGNLLNFFLFFVISVKKKLTLDVVNCKDTKTESIAMPTLRHELKK